MSWLDTIQPQKRPRPIRELSTEELELFLFVETARARRSELDAAVRRTTGLVVAAVLFFSVGAFLLGALVSTFVGGAFR